ncbi:TadE/TadG family type IV pilus assembly protein [Parasphingorhabdus halotolerans]|uniref:Pilus assembly protein n=1 Tax=Parasphingorhabdus halotolerans TaxID=2725558 RepID=A0A6H2DIE0_9SPHN|nr:TadE/TadG family type IV pilus assembly protein [Parasphingorhabdus halotolerans]QJB67907.1 pilus assembly protein [Parasphingorhabdus halotolerans]
MRIAPSKIKHLQALVKDNSGLALLEFAMGLPLFLALALGGLEFANLATSHMRVSQIAMTVADNAARVDPAIDEADIHEIFSAVSLMGEPLDLEANGRVILSSLQHNGLTGSDEGQMINWQRCLGDLAVEPAYGKEGKGKTGASLRDGMGPTGKEIAADPSTAVMFVEVVYDYQQLIPGKLFSRQIRYETAFNVRSRDVFDISNSSSPALIVKSCA